jgi:hypothetical protein
MTGPAWRPDANMLPAPDDPSVVEVVAVRLAVNANYSAASCISNGLTTCFSFSS